MTYKIGDIVRLKSGGPLMTVTSVGKDEKGRPVVWTVWFTKNDEEKTGYYSIDVLKADDGGPVIA